MRQYDSYLDCRAARRIGALSCMNDGVVAGLCPRRLDSAWKSRLEMERPQMACLSVRRLTSSPHLACLSRPSAMEREP